ncbi:hypothetical protein [Arcicella lustrica]|uniref:ATP-grasp domain-containing protein n=1 Tax=Arcicella lustrica TaxID=2984196 RepID=A0ABU5SIN4_9BACT|nr:hypothetical protein [Arcicella sp. DC25W]MEA5427133.1 hypothetical protein [Arcicella sp. DC25W]
MYKVLLVSVGHFFDSTAEIPSIFKRAGCTVDIFCSEKSWLKSNKFHDNWIQASEEEESFKYELADYVKKNPDKYNWILLLDEFTLKLMNNFIGDDPFLFEKLLPITKIENREVLSSKIGMSRACSRYNITTPRFINYTEDISLDDIAKNLHFPILLKEDFSFSGLGIQHCANINDFQPCLDKVLNKKNLVLQEFIEGDDIGVEALFYEGQLVSYNCATILSYMGGKFSFTTRRTYYQDAALAKELKKLGESFGISGFGSIQYIYHKGRNLFYLIETDLRSNSWMPYSKFTGKDIADGVRQIISGKIIGDFSETTPLNARTEIAIFDRDIRRCMKYKDLKGFLRWAVNYKGYWKFIPFYDTKLFNRIFTKLYKDLFKIKY